MKLDTSRWRDSRTYDYFDDLSVEGLPWECLRRDPSYQQGYRNLVGAERADAPLPAEAEHECTEGDGGGARAQPGVLKNRPCCRLSITAACMAMPGVRVPSGLV